MNLHRYNTKTRTHVFEILNTTNTFFGENCEFSWVQVSLQTKKCKCIIQSIWIIMTWQHISLEVFVKSFKKCSISNAVDGTGNMLWNCSEVCGYVKSQCKEDESTEYDNDTEW